MFSAKVFRIWIAVFASGNCLTENLRGLFRCYNPRAAVTFETQQVTPISGNQIVRIARLGHREQEVVGRIGWHINDRRVTRRNSSI